MNIRRFQPGEELALFEVYYSAIHLIAKNDYTPRSGESQTSPPQAKMEE